MYSHISQSSRTGLVCLFDFARVLRLPALPANSPAVFILNVHF